jgi:hypothetical protein
VCDADGAIDTVDAIDADDEIDAGGEIDADDAIDAGDGGVGRTNAAAAVRSPCSC